MRAGMAMTLRFRKSQLLAAGLMIALALFGSLFFQVNSAAARSVNWNAYDVTLQLKQDSSFHVTERQDVSFAGGPFTYAYATIPLTRIDDLRNVTVAEVRSGSNVTYTRSNSGAPETYTIEYSSTDVTIT